MLNTRREVEQRLEAGMSLRSIAQIERDLRTLGYRLDRSDDLRHIAQDVESGHTFACTTTGIRHIGSGLSFAHVDAPRDSNFRALQAYRLNTFACKGGAVFDL